MRVPCKIAYYATIAVAQSLDDDILGPAVRVTLGSISGSLFVKTPMNSVAVEIPAEVLVARGGILEDQITEIQGAATKVLVEWARDE